LKTIGGDPEVVGPWVMKRAGGSWFSGNVAIGLWEDRELLAGVAFDSFNHASVCMHVAAVPGKRWLNKAYLRTCFDYPFKQLGVNKILGLVSSSNLEAQAFDEHLGFVLEATLKDAHPSGDLLIYTMTQDQCPWLRIKVPSWAVHSENPQLHQHQTTQA
jgi:RimJ/RimL family protein N-acetyltransferase